MRHVDVIKNEWLAGFQLVVARLRLDEKGHLRVDAQQPWRGMVERYRDEMAGRTDGQFLDSLHEHLTGDYLFATPPHDDGEGCEFAEFVLPMKAELAKDAEGTRQHA